jgi:hypothetical protein
MTTTSTRHRFVILALVVGLLLVVSDPLAALAQSADPRAFPDTGFTISDDAVWTFFTEHGGAATFGPPISRQFTFMGVPTQLFETAALQIQADGSVRPTQLSDLPSCRTRISTD